MSLLSNCNAIIAGCINPLHPDFFVNDGLGKYRLSMELTVNRPVWTAWIDVESIWDCPGYPTTLGIRMYERRSTHATTDPIMQIDGFVADCSDPGSGLGAAKWLKMATLQIKFAQGLPQHPTWIHLMHYGTNADSVGFVLIGHSPP